MFKYVYEIAPIDFTDGTMLIEYPSKIILTVLYLIYLGIRIYC